MTWEIFLGISALVAFVLLLINPISKLTSAVTKLSCAVEKLDENQSTTTKRIEVHGEQIDDHEKRLTKAEGDIQNITEKVNYFHDV